MRTFRGVKSSFKSEQDDQLQPRREAQIKLICVQGENNWFDLKQGSAADEVKFFSFQDKLVQWKSGCIGTDGSCISKSHLDVLENKLLRASLSS